MQGNPSATAIMMIDDRSMCLTCSPVQAAAYSHYVGNGCKGSVCAVHLAGTGTPQFLRILSMFYPPATKDGKHDNLAAKELEQQLEFTSLLIYDLVAHRPCQMLCF